MVIISIRGLKDTHFDLDHVRCYNALQNELCNAVALVHCTRINT